MYMFLPFLLALGATLGVLVGKTRLGYAMWATLVLITLLSFEYHVSDPLALSF